MGRYFGTDGIRGVANEKLTCELALALGRASSTRLAERASHIFIARDTRISGNMLECAFSAGANSVGAHVRSGGIVPTPAVSLLTVRTGASMGVMISASHNPVPDNGIKLFAADGYKLPDAVEREIESLMDGGKSPSVFGTDIGVAEDMHEYALNTYIEHVTENAVCTLEGFKIVLDCGYGAAWKAGPEIFSRLGAQVTALHNEPDGSRINVNCGSTNLAALKRKVLEEKAHMGIAFDGDADRCLAVDEKGVAVDGDQIMGILALYLKRNNLLRGNCLVSTVMSNLGFELAMKRQGIDFLRTSVGDRYVLEKMRELDASIGGEQSGHIILKDLNSTGDGPMTAAMLASVVKRSGMAVSELARIFEPMPQILLNVSASDKDGLNRDPGVLSVINEKTLLLGDRGRILVRPSGTEPLIRVMVEGESRQEIEEIAREVCSVIEERLK